MAGGLRAVVDPVSRRPAALHEGPQRVGDLLEDRNLRFHLYDLAEPTPHVESLLAEIDADPAYIFWG